jgi:O-antigen/teichoic acid export membrane protein
VAFITVTAAVAARVAKTGIGHATVVYAAQRPRARPQLLGNLIAFSLATSLAAAVLVVGGVWLSGSEPAGIEHDHLPILAAAIVAASLIDDNFLIGCRRLRESAAIAATGGWLYAGALAVALITVDLTVESAALAWVAAHVIWGALLAATGARTDGLQLPDLRLLAESVRFGARAWLGSVSLFLNARLDQILVGLIASEAALGLYAVAVNAGEILLFLPTAIATSLLPVVAGEEGPARQERTLRSFRAAAIMTLGSILAAALLGPLLIPPVFGSNFDGAVEPFLLLLPGALGYAALSVFSNALLASRAPGFSSFGSAAALGGGLALDLALIPAFGASGAAAAASTAFLAGGAVAATLYRRIAAFDWRELLPGRADVAFLRATMRRVVS